MRYWKRRLSQSILHLVDMEMDTVMRAMIMGTDRDMGMGTGKGTGKQAKQPQHLGRQ